MKWENTHNNGQEEVMKMKRKRFFAATALVLAAFMGISVGCAPDDTKDPGSENPGTEEPGENPGTPETPKTYTITFMNGDQVVKTQTGKTGKFVEIPENPANSDPRYKFVGWEGLDSADAEAGKVEIFGEDQTFNAIWYEQFGTDTTFTATKVRSTDTITVDGEKDTAYSDAVSVPVTTVASGETDTTANACFMWDDQFYYIFVEVNDDTIIGRDYSYEGEQWTEHNDTVEIWMDILHDDSSHGPGGYSGGFGGAYRGEPGPMCEAQFKINPGAQYPKGDVRYGADSEFGFDGWWSNEAKNDGLTVGTTKIKDDNTGYTVEYRISTSIANIPEELRPFVGQEIGIGVKVYDKTTADEEGAAKNNPAPNQVTMENIAGYMSGPKKLSNVRLVANANDSNTLIGVKQVRDCYSVTVDNKEDLLYKDALESAFGESKVKMLWDSSNVYAYVTLGENTKSLKFESPLLSDPVELTADGGTTQEIVIPGSFALDAMADLKVTYQDGDAEAVSSDYLLRMQTNDSNIAGSPRKMYEAKKLADGASITVDGTRDAAYGTDATVAIDTVTLSEANGGPKATGMAWIVWDDTALYVFVEVTDSDVSASQVGDAHLNDSVEFWLDTCQQLPTSSTRWGEGNRPLGLYRGEGCFRVLANKVGADTGMHWLWDDERTRPATASVLTETGYTVEYSIPWAHKFDEWDNGFGDYIPSLGGPGEKTGQVINFLININDDNGNDGVREGIVCQNTMGQSAIDYPYVLDHLKLVAAD